MSYPNDFEGYQKGYEDAMRAAGQGATGTSAPAGKRGRDIGGTVQRGIGTAFGWLILFPLFMGLMGGSIAWFLGGSFVGMALFFGLIAFLFAAFAGAVIVGWRLFLALWPIIIVVGIVIVIVLKLLG